MKPLNRLLTLAGAGLLLLVTGCSPSSFAGRETTPSPSERMPYAEVATASAPPAAEAASAAPVVTAAVPAAAHADVNPVTGRRQYSADVKPRYRLAVVAEAAGRVLELNVEVGDRVEAGQLLALIDSAALEAQRAQALAALEAAQSQLTLLLQGPAEEELEAARAAVAAADAVYQHALDGASEEERRLAEAELRQAEAAVAAAQAAYDRVEGSPLITVMPESLQLQQAMLAAEVARAQYDKVLKGTADDLIAGAYAQLAGARAALEQLEAGAKPAQIDAARAQVREAETALYLAQLQLDKATVKAPVDGIVAEVNTMVGSMAASGTPLVLLNSPEVEIPIFVEEPLLAELAVGQPALIRVAAYPDRTVAGEISAIAPEVDPLTRTVRATIRPVGDPLLVPGMAATVELGMLER